MSLEKLKFYQNLINLAVEQKTNLEKAENMQDESVQMEEEKQVQENDRKRKTEFTDAQVGNDVRDKETTSRQHHQQQPMELQGEKKKYNHIIKMKTRIHVLKITHKKIRLQKNRKRRVKNFQKNKKKKYQQQMTERKTPIHMLKINHKKSRQPKKGKTRRKKERKKAQQRTNNSKKPRKRSKSSYRASYTKDSG